MELTQDGPWVVSHVRTAAPLPSWSIGYRLLPSSTCDGVSTRCPGSASVHSSQHVSCPGPRWPWGDPPRRRPPRGPFEGTEPERLIPMCSSAHAQQITPLRLRLRWAPRTVPRCSRFSLSAVPCCFVLSLVPPPPPPRRPGCAVAIQIDTSRPHGAWGAMRLVCLLAPRLSKEFLPQQEFIEAVFEPPWSLSGAGFQRSELATRGGGVRL